MLERHVDAGDAPGAVAVVARHGEVHVEAVGNLAFDGAGSRIPMAGDTICRIASMTKPIVAACAMTLLEDSTVRLDDPIDDLLPELAQMTVLTDPNGSLEDTTAAIRPITLRDLLTFTLGTGMAVGIGIGALDGEPGTVPIADAVDALEPPPPPDEYMRRLGELPLFFQPGERWMYELAADVTVVLVARATGMSFGDALQERICLPLAMTDTTVSVRAGDRSRLATAYRRDDVTGEVLVEDGPDGPWSRPPEFESGGGGLVSTADDYPPSPRRCAPAAPPRRAGPVAGVGDADDHRPPERGAEGGLRVLARILRRHRLGFGVSVRTRRTHLGPSVGSYGWNGYGCAWYTDPTEDMTTIHMAQQLNAPRWRLDLSTAAYWRSTTDSPPKTTTCLGPATVPCASERL